MIVQRLLQGDPRRRTRLHDYEGNPLPTAGFVDLLPCVASTLLLKCGIHFRSPWFPYPAVRYLGRLVDPSWRVLEFGSGASTIWLSRRAGCVVSHEHDPAWHAWTQAKLAALDRNNVELRLLPSRHDYCAIDAREIGRFDLVLVDGHWRDYCAQAALRAVRSGGFIYLDNSDVPDPDHRAAVQILSQAAAVTRRFIGLCPGHIAVNQGLLVRAPQ